MSESTAGQPSTEPYDPAEDPDADPANLAPREGDQAIPGQSSGDPDADPDMLKPRADRPSGDV